jgi:hypothetical protein
MADEMMVRGLTDAHRAAIQEKYPRAKWTVGDGDEWECALVPPPNSADVKLYKHKIHTPEERSEAQEVLWKKMVVYVWTKWTGSGSRVDAMTWDPPGAMDKFLATFPMAPEGCGDAFGALLGIKSKSRGE